MQLRLCVVNTLLLSIFAEKADLIAPSFHCVVAKDLVNLTTVMCAIKAVYGKYIIIVNIC